METIGISSTLNHGTPKALHPNQHKPSGFRVQGKGLGLRVQGLGFRG